MGKSKGKRSKSRYKLRKNVRDRGKVSTRKIIQDFPEGTKTFIKIDSSVPAGQPHPKFHGNTGEVVGKQGKCYLVDIKEGNKVKRVIARPEHLEKVEK